MTAPKDLVDLIEDADIDWLKDALHAVLGVIRDLEGRVPALIREAIRSELTYEVKDE